MKAIIRTKKTATRNIKWNESKIVDWTFVETKSWLNREMRIIHFISPLNPKWKHDNVTFLKYKQVQLNTTSYSW